MIRKLLAVTTTAIVSTIGLVAFDSSAQAATCPAAPTPVAHRGGTERYVEDTRDAFLDSAANVGVRFWENDVRFTADNVPVIMHDETVDRTTNGSGAVADLTWAQIAGLRTSDDQSVPTLRDFINDQSVMRAYAFVELKVMPTEAQWSTFIAALTSRASAGTPRPAIESFDPAVLDQVAARLPGYTRALVQSVGDADPADITPHAGILLKHHDAITAGRLAKWTSAGLRVYAWADPNAGDNPAEWARMAGYGNVSGFITSTPGAYITWRSNRSC